MINIEKCRHALDRLSTFVQRFRPLVDVCMVDFIEKDLFSSHIENQDLRKELLTLSDDDITELPKAFLARIEKANYIGRSKSCVDIFLDEIALHSLDHLGICLSSSEAFAQFPQLRHSDRPSDENQELLFHHFDRIMGEKKTHEVTILSELISQMACNFNDEGNKLERLIDLGSGKGYLSQALSKIYSFKVLAIDASDGNIRGSVKRSDNLEKKWTSLTRRAKSRADGKDPPKRGKHWKGKSFDQKNEINAEELDAKIESEKRNLVFIAQYVDTRTDLVELADQHFEDSGNKSFAISGLHTCGNLASSSIRIFLKNVHAKMLVNVGCCYHHLNEEFYQHPYLTSEENLEINLNPGFPLSSLLRQKKFILGRNARMMAAQPTNRMAKSNELPSKSLLWRAILQVLLVRNCPDLCVRDQQVGRTAAKSNDFVDYTRKAIEKLNLTDQMQISDDELIETFTRLSHQFDRKLNVFYQLRSLFAPIIEGLILLDRLVFLLEQKDIEAGLVRLFDPVISPRCYALVAFKKSTE